MESLLRQSMQYGLLRFCADMTRLVGDFGPGKMEDSDV